MQVHIQRSAMGAAVAVAALLTYGLIGSGEGNVTTTRSANDSPAENVATQVLAAHDEIRDDETPDDATDIAAKSAQGGSQALQVAPRFSGDAEVDLPEGSPGVIVIADLAGGVHQRDVPPPIAAVQPKFEMGWDIKDVRVKYVAVTDELIVALNSYGIVGDPEGNGDPALFDPDWTAAKLNGSDIGDLGPSEGVTFALDLDSDGAYDVAIGTHYGNSINEFAVHEYREAPYSPPVAPPTYGDPIDTLGTAPQSPSSAAPDLVFSIANFSKLPGNDGSLDFGINVMNGSGADGNIGEDSLGNFDVAVPVHLDAQIGDYVWSDTNQDGIANDDEPGIADVTVNLRNSINEVVASTTTGSDGKYQFLVAPGNYIVEFVAPHRAVFSPRFATAAETTDSDADPNTGRSGIVRASTSSTEFTIDAGIIEFVAAPSIDIEKLTEGQDADVPSGPELEVGSTVTFTYLVTNTGNVDLMRIKVSDDKGIAVSCPATELGVGDSMGCTASAIVTEGPYRNVGTAVGVPTDSGGDTRQTVSDSDPSNHVGFIAFIAAPGVDLQKYTNGEDADDATGPVLTVGDPVNFTYEVTNTGNVELTKVVVSDDILGDICVLDSLAPGEQTECAAISTVLEGQYVNIGSVEGVPVTPGGAELDAITDEDRSHHIGVPAGPACVANMHGPRMHSGGVVVANTNYVAAAGSTIIIVTSEPGQSPDQPHEQVYVQVGEDIYGPTPLDLGPLEITVENTGPVAILHHSVVMDDDTRANSVEYDWCGTDLTIPTVHACPAALAGPRMYAGATVTWEPELTAAAGSTISITTSEPGNSPGQPHEQVYVMVGDELFGPTPNKHGTTTFEVGDGGEVSVQHYSVINSDSHRANSVEIELCGSHLTKVS